MQEMVTFMDQRAHGLKFWSEDSYDLTLLCYQSRFTEHASSVLRLEMHPDSSLVARCALDGLWQLKWASHDPSTRALRWRHHIEPMRASPE